MKTSKIMFLSLIFNFLFLISTSTVNAAVNPELIKTQVQETVEARRVGKEAEFLVDSEDSGLYRDDKEETATHSLLWGLIKIKKINGQWYFSLGRK